MSGLEMLIWVYAHIISRKTKGNMELPADGVLKNKRKRLEINS